jgi:tetratricopeptide (TPR) repeat protein
MGYHPAAVRQFAEWSNRRMIKAGVVFRPTGETFLQCCSAESVSVSTAWNILQDWRKIGQAIIMQNSGDGICPTYDGHQAAAKVNLKDMQQNERPELVYIANNLIAMMTMCPPTNTPVELFLEGQWTEHIVSFSCQQYWKRRTDGAVRNRLFSPSDNMTLEAVSALQRHALIEVEVDEDGKRLAMHQLMAAAVRAELRQYGSHPGVRDLRALLTARYGLTEEEGVDADDFVVMRQIGDAAEYTMASIVKRIGDADIEMQRWAFSMYLRMARVQFHVTRNAATVDRLLVAAKGCLQRTRSESSSWLNHAVMRLRLYEAEMPIIQGDYEKSLVLLQTMESDFGKISNLTLMDLILCDIGNALQSLGEYDKALEYHTRALDIRIEKEPRQPAVAKSFHSIGYNMLSKGNYGIAVEFYTRALDIQMEKLGPRHPDTANTLNGLGIVFGSMGKYSKAVEYFTRALDIQMETLGLGHPDVARSLHNIGWTFWSDGEHDKAIVFYTRALDMKMTRLGPRHPDVARTLNNIGNVFVSKGEYNQGVEYYTRALDIWFQTLGFHPRTASCLSNLSYSLMRTHQYAAAADCIIACLQTLASNPAFEQELICAMKDGRYGCRVHVLVQQQRWKDVLPLLPLLDRIASLAGGGANVCLYLTAAADVYQRCDMPSRAAAAMLRAAAALRQLGASLTSRQMEYFQEAGLCWQPDELELSAHSLELISLRCVTETDMPFPTHTLSLNHLCLPVRSFFLSYAILVATPQSRSHLICSCQRSTYSRPPSPTFQLPSDGSCHA